MTGTPRRYHRTNCLASVQLRKVIQKTRNRDLASLKEIFLNRATLSRIRRAARISANCIGIAGRRLIRILTFTQECPNNVGPLAIAMAAAGRTEKCHHPRDSILGEVPLFKRLTYVQTPYSVTFMLEIYFLNFSARQSELSVPNPGPRNTSEAM